MSDIVPLLGIETEYGIIREDQEESDPVEESMRLLACCEAKSVFKLFPLFQFEFISAFGGPVLCLGPGDGGDRFRWSLNIPAAGNYDVYAWWTYHNNRSSSVPYYIHHAAGTDVVIVDQHDTSLAGQWVLLGSYTFAPGSGQSVEVSSENGQASADAVKLIQR